MVDPYDFVASPSASRSKQTRRRPMAKTTKKRKSNEKPRRVPSRGAPMSKTHVRTRSNTRDVDHEIDAGGKENTNHGFTQLIQTKLMEVKKRQGGKKVQKPMNTRTDGSHSPSVARKRPRTGRQRRMYRLAFMSNFVIRSRRELRCHTNINGHR